MSADGQGINEETLDKIIKSLGVLPNPRDSVDKLLFVEGNHDINALTEYSRILNENDDSIINIGKSENIAYVIAGGSSLKFYIDRKYLSGLGKAELHLYDNDIEEYRNYVQQINEQHNLRKKAFNTTKRELENYLTKEAIQEAYADNDTIVVIPDFGDNDDVPQIVARALYETDPEKNWLDLDESQRKRRESKVKKLLNTQAVSKMTIARLEQNNGKNDLELWLKTLNELE